MSGESVTLYTTRQLAGVLDQLARPHTFLLDTFFPRMMNFETEYIDFDIVLEEKTLAPFVSPMVAGKPQRERGQQTKSFKPAYLKPKTPVDPNRPFKRQPGETYATQMTAMARRDAQIADILETHRRQILRRKEWMAAQALQFGKVTVEGEDFPKVEVDFGRDAALTDALTTSARWGETGVKIMDDIEDWASLVSEKSGANANQVIMDPKAWRIARTDEDFLAVLDNRRQDSGSAELGSTSLAAKERAARWVGTVGDFDFWVYNQTYKDEAGSTAKMLADYTVMLGSADIEGVQAHGAIRDPRAGLQAMEVFAKNWIEDDPAEEFVMSQSAPLMVPARADASFAATVHDGT